MSMCANLLRTAIAIKTYPANFSYSAKRSLT